MSQRLSTAVDEHYSRNSQSAMRLIRALVPDELVVVVAIEDPVWLNIVAGGMEAGVWTVSC